MEMLHGIFTTLKIHIWATKTVIVGTHRHYILKIKLKLLIAWALRKCKRGKRVIEWKEGNESEEEKG